MAQSFLNSLTAPSGSSFIPKPVLADTSSAMNPQNMPLMQAGVVPQVTTPTVQSTPVAPVQSPTEMYNPTVGTSTQRVADATYANAMNQAVSGSTPVPSSVIGSGSNLSSAGATRSTNEAILQQYLDQQKQYQQQLLQANQAGPTESAAAQRYNQLKTQAALNQEQALASGETSSFAGGEAQRVARTDAIKLAGAAADLQYMTGQREQAVKTLEALMASGDKSFSAQLKIQELQQTVSGIDKQAQDTLYNYLQKPEYAGIEFTPDPTKTPTDNLNDFRKLAAKQDSTKAQDLTPRQAAMLNSIINQANNSPLIKAADRAVVLKDSIDNARANPKAGYVQQNLVYSYVQALDTYQSAVREGEMKAVSNLDSLFGQFDNTIQKINNGQYARPEVVEQMAGAAELLYKSISKAAEQKDKSFAAQADVLGVGEDYATYRGKFQRSYESGSTQDYSAQDTQAIQKISPSTKKTFTQEQIDEYKRLKGFSQVGSDTKPATEQNLTSGFGNMQGLMGQLPPMEFGSTDFSSMSGLMQATPTLKQTTYKAPDAVIPKTSRIAFVHNNPGNLKFMGQPGATKGEPAGDGGYFAKFQTTKDGLMALRRQIQLDISRGHTVESFISKYAPPNSNDTEKYIKSALNTFGVTRNTKISDVPTDELLKFLANYESSTKVY